MTATSPLSSHTDSLSPTTVSQHAPRTTATSFSRAWGQNGEPLLDQRATRRSSPCRVLITGAGSGLGRLTVGALLDSGHTVTGSLRAVAGRNREVAEELTAEGASVVEIDVVINNAGLGALGL